MKGFLSAADPHEGPVFDFPGLRVQAASPQMLLAMKVVAARIGEDDDDVAWLADRLGLTTAAEVLDEVVAVVGEERLGPRSRFFVEQVVGEGG